MMQRFPFSSAIRSKRINLFLSQSGIRPLFVVVIRCTIASTLFLFSSLSLWTSVLLFLQTHSRPISGSQKVESYITKWDIVMNRYLIYFTRFHSTWLTAPSMDLCPVVYSFFYEKYDSLNPVPMSQAYWLYRRTIKKLYLELNIVISVPFLRKVWAL